MKSVAGYIFGLIGGISIVFFLVLTVGGFPQVAHTVGMVLVYSILFSDLLHAWKGSYSKCILVYELEPYLASKSADFGSAIRTLFVIAYMGAILLVTVGWIVSVSR